MTTDTSEKRLERLICTALTGHPCDRAAASDGPSTPSGIPEDACGGCGWIGGSPSDYEREYGVDLVQLAAFLQTTQPKVAEALDLGADGPARAMVVTSGIERAVQYFHAIRGQGLPERAAELGQAERPHRTRQGAGARDDGSPEGRHGALQAVYGQRVVQTLDDRYRLRADL
jgi:hypothetical protein